MISPFDGRHRRIALYSHDSQGLGHVRRNLAIASALAEADSAVQILLLTGAPGAASLPAPPGADFLTLPAIGKGRDGTYRARSLASSFDAIIELRSRVLHAALSAFDPDLLIVDKVPRGAGGELEPALASLRTTGRTRCVLGLRDVLDDAAVARRQWREDRATEAVAHFYDQVWVYGDPRVLDPVAEYDLPPIVAARTTYTGYLGHGRPLAATTATAAPPRPFVLCLVGGGQDGSTLAQNFLAARLPEGRSGLVVTGPYMAADDRLALQRVAARRPDMTVEGFVDGVEHLIDRAESVVSMGGYNSVCELLASGARTLLVPRARPRTEQLVRAECLARHGLVEVLHPDVLSPCRLSGWMAGSSRPATEVPIDLDGLSRIPALVDTLLGAADGAGHVASRQEVTRVCA
ncbi:MAG: glycosyltransferase [Actinomycetota bacterium]|nr:glycosyltransferase [Actinomycetota bacterium]